MENNMPGWSLENERQGIKDGDVLNSIFPLLPEIYDVVLALKEHTIF